MAVVIDGVMKEWGDRLYYITVRARPAPKTTRGYRSQASPTKPPRRATALGVRAALARTVKKTPEVMVKISGGGKDMRKIKAHMDYISRNGDVPLQDETGQLIDGKEAVRALRDDWATNGGQAIPYENGYRREAFNIILSMPPGTDRDAVRAAAAEFAAARFSGHQYVFASHDDEKHPHVHLCVKVVSRDMVRLNPRKADLQAWRETFAEKLRENGIEANATARAVRGRARRGEKQAVRHIDSEFKQKKRPSPSRATLGREQAVQQEVAGIVRHEHPAEKKLSEQRTTVVKGFGHIATALADSPVVEDKKLAVEIVTHVRQMEPAKTAHRLAVERMQQHSSGGVNRDAKRADRDRTGPVRE